jgi:hypothetical protein
MRGEKFDVLFFIAQREADGKCATEFSKSDADKGARAPVTGWRIIHDVFAQQCH